MNTVIGIDVGGTDIKAATFAPDGTMLKQWTRPTRDAKTEGIPVFAQTVRALLEEMGAMPDTPVGIAAPGLVGRDGRAIVSMPGKMHGIEHLDWTNFLERKQVVPVLNDAHAALLGEVWHGAAKGCRHAILLTLGTGVGGAIWSDGRLLKGFVGRAGHLGHTSINGNTSRSIMGTPGALEVAIGDYTVGERSGDRFSHTSDLVAAHLRGDAGATAVWLRSIQDLARALTSFINILDPEIIILGGGIAAAGEALFVPLAAELEPIEWRPGGHRVRIVPAQLGGWAGAYGAAWNAMDSE